jgi:hypothetical protein
MKLSYEQRYTVEGYHGIAFWYAGPELVPDADSEWTGEMNETGMARMVMVGDDREFIIDPDDCTVISFGDYCPECGQIGCTASLV